MQKWRGKAWEIESRAWCQVDVRGAVPGCCNSQTLYWSASSLPNNELYWHCLSNVTVSNLLDKILQEGLQDSSSSTAPLMSTLMSTWCHACDSISQAFLLRFCILQAIKNLRRELPGNEANNIAQSYIIYGLPDHFPLGSAWSCLCTVVSACIIYYKHTYVRS